MLGYNNPTKAWYSGAYDQFELLQIRLLYGEFNKNESNKV